MEFTPEQQAHIDKLISKKYAEAMSKAETKAAETIAATEAKYMDELNTLKGQVDSLKAAQGESNERIRRALLKAEVAPAGAVNVEQVMKLINESVIIGEDGELAVVDAEGKAKFTAEGKPYEVKAFVSEYLDANPHLKQATRSTGAGSMSASFFSSGMGATKTIKRGEFDSMSPAQKSNYLHGGGTLTD